MKQVSFGTFIYKPLPAVAVKRILACDRQHGFGPGGYQPNRNRFYSYLTQQGSDVQIRIVAVKAVSPKEKPVVKDVVLCSVDDDSMHVRDIAFSPPAGYIVDWSPEGVGSSHQWSYEGCWEDEPYRLSGMWKPNAPVVNPELLLRTRRFKWSSWSPSNGCILDYLKLYKNNPDLEFLSKAGLGRYCVKTTFVKKLAKDPEFRSFVSRHSNEIRMCVWIDVTTIKAAYHKGISIDDAYTEKKQRQAFKGYWLPPGISLSKACEYIKDQKESAYRYSRYLTICSRLGKDVNDTKTAFPKNFKSRYSVVLKQEISLNEKLNEERNAEVSKKISIVANEWSWLERRRGTYRFVLPRSVADLSSEGVAMKNCLTEFNYAKKISDGKSVIVFVRRKSALKKAFVAVEYSPERGIVMQCYGANNSPVSKKVSVFVDRAFCGASISRNMKAA